MNGQNYQSRDAGQRLTRVLTALVIGVVAMGVFALKGCQRGPFGRRQMVAMSPQQEVALGAQAFREVLSDAQVVPSGPAAQDVQEITRRLVRATANPTFQNLTRIPTRDYQWEVRLVRSREVNAFCLPGGKMVVYTGILPVAQTDAGLATVMGHEISHALAQHGAERMAQTRLAQIGITAAGASTGDMDARDRMVLMQVLNAGAQFGILRYSRKHESEADHIGLLLMAAAGYDPEESVKFWERMQAVAGKGGRPPEFLSTHPSHETRIRDLLRWVPEAMPLYQQSGYRDPPQKLHPVP
ncbi:MAG: M48 family metallopeptidase [Gemmataceae bacterium]